MLIIIFTSSPNRLTRNLISPNQFFLHEFRCTGIFTCYRTGSVYLSITNEIHGATQDTNKWIKHTTKSMKNHSRGTTSPCGALERSARTIRRSHRYEKWPPAVTNIEHLCFCDKQEFLPVSSLVSTSALVLISNGTAAGFGFPIKSCLDIDRSLHAVDFAVMHSPTHALKSLLNSARIDGRY